MVKEKKLAAFAIIRVDIFHSADVPLENRITIKRVMWNEMEAVAEVNRLNTLNEGCYYFSQSTRVDALHKPDAGKTEQTGAVPPGNQKSFKP